MRLTPVATSVLLLMLVTAPGAAAQGRFPPDSLVNTRVIPRNTPVINVIGRMRDITFALGVRCQYCHIGEEGQPLSQFDFVSDERRTKRIAREMLRMTEQINNTVLAGLPDRASPPVAVTCNTCHRGVTRPIPLAQLIAEVAQAAGADSALRAYRELRAEHYGGDAYDFGESSLNIAAFRLGRERRFAEAMAILGLNQELFPAASSTFLFRGNIELMRADTNAAAAAFREAIRLNPADGEAAMRLRQTGRPR